MKTYNITELIDRLNKSGRIKSANYFSGRQTINYWIKTDVLRLRKIEPKGSYYITEGDMKEIIKALSDNGKGYWHWDETGESKDHFNDVSGELRNRISDDGV